MGKKVVQKRTAYFKLEQDGFSIHTFELSCELSGYQMTQVLNTLYGEQKQENPAKSWIYQNKAKNHVCTRYRKHGIRIVLNDNRGNASASRCFVYMTVNPRLLIDPDASYRGILPPEKESVRRVKKAFGKLFKGSPFNGDINAYQLRRVDLCTNLHCDHKKIFRETVRVLRKLPTPPKYERKEIHIKNKREERDANKHYLRFHCDSKDLVIYDKSYQLIENRLVMTREEVPEGVLRFEVQYQREYIRRAEKDAECEKLTDLLWYYIKESKSLLYKNFKSCFDDVSFCRMEEIEASIAKANFKDKSKESMLRLAQLLRRKQSVDKALEELEKGGVSTDGLLDRFIRMGISPVPLWQSFCAKRIPGPVELLRDISSGEIPVKYEKIKSK